MRQSQRCGECAIAESVKVPTMVITSTERIGDFGISISMRQKMAIPGDDVICRELRDVVPSSGRCDAFTRRPSVKKSE